MFELEYRQKILVSACLLGEPCRYDGASVPCEGIIGLAGVHELVPVCPEQLGGLPTPRVPSEIQADGRVVDQNGVDRTDAFKLGAEKAVEVARAHGCTHAILKARSPSCGVCEVYDGSFTGVLVEGEGIAARALRETGVHLLDETAFQQ